MPRFTIRLYSRVASSVFTLFSLWFIRAIWLGISCRISVHRLQFHGQQEINSTHSPNSPSVVLLGLQHKVPDATNRRHTIYCNTSVYPILDWKLSGWFYHSMFKSCRPLYSLEGEHVCIENQDLPKTREMCEDLCGESCVMSDGSMGICMFNEMCKIVNNRPSAHPRPCGSYNVNCCPKVSDSNLVPYRNPSGNNNGDGELENRINAADNSSSQTDTIYVYRFPNAPPMARKLKQ